MPLAADGDGVTEAETMNSYYSTSYKSRSKSMVRTQAYILCKKSDDVIIHWATTEPQPFWRVI